MRPTEALARPILAQRGHLLGWAPVCLGLGIGLYFALAFEPAPAQLAAGAVLVLVLVLSARAVGGAASPLLLALALVGAGVGTAGFRTQRVAAPVLEYRYYGPIVGRLIGVDVSASDAPRLTLDRVVLEGTAPAATPRRVRVSLHGPPPPRLRPGDRLGLSGHLMPPGGPVEPGGFDFRRSAWFRGLGAVGYTRSPVVLLRGGGAALPLARARLALSEAIRARIPGEPGTFAAAITTGDRSAVSPETREALRRSNLAHLLAISGLHMGLLTGVVFGAVRLGLSLVPALALRWPLRKIAAATAMLAGAAYLGLSGGAVATERAYVMVSVMFLAVLLDRRAITLRAVALAALVVLLRRPEELTGPGFQMSFAATTALVAVFRAMRGPLRHLPGWARPLAAVALSSLVAALATAPFAAAHFNRLAPYGLVANLLAVPVMGSLVMPAAVLAAVLAPLGAAGPALWAMEIGLRWILAVAGVVSGWSGATSPVVTPAPLVLPALALGGLWAILWQGRARWAGVVPLAAALLFWPLTERPVLLVSDSGGLLGVRTAAGRALSRSSGEGFVASVWLENDGEGLDQVSANALWEVPADQPLRIGPLRIAQARGKRALALLEGCAGADILVTDQEGAGERPCEVLDPARLARSGALAVFEAEGGGLRAITARERSGERPWSNWPPGPPPDLPTLGPRQGPAGDQ